MTVISGAYREDMLGISPLRVEEHMHVKRYNRQIKPAHAGQYVALNERMRIKTLAAVALTGDLKTGFHSVTGP